MAGEGVLDTIASRLKVDSENIPLLFGIVLAFIVAILPVAILISSVSVMSVTDGIVLLVPIGILLVTLLLATVYYEMVGIQHQQAEIMQAQSGWAEAAHSPAVVLNNWSVENDALLFRMQNLGNSFVERMELQTNVRVLNEDDTVVETYQSTSPLQKPGVEGFRSRLLETDIEGGATFRADVLFPALAAESERTVVGLKPFLDELTEDSEDMIRVELAFTLEIVPPGGNSEEREFWMSRVGIFEGKTVEELVYGTKQKRFSQHVAPRGWKAKP